MNNERLRREPSKRNIMIPSTTMELLISCCSDEEVGAVIRGVVNYDLYGDVFEIESNPAKSIARILCEEVDEQMYKWRRKWQRYGHE